MPAKSDFPAVFAALRPILAAHAPKLVVRKDARDDFQLYAPKPDARGRDMYFGGVRIGKSYVSFHLMPVYVHPELLDGAPEALRARMQGKSCFNFRDTDATTLAALRRLTKAGFDAFRKDGLI